MIVVVVVLVDVVVEHSTVQASQQLGQFLGVPPRAAQRAGSRATLQRLTPFRSRQHAT
jgi:hypothetical protein